MDMSRGYLLAVNWREKVSEEMVQGVDCVTTIEEGGISYLVLPGGIKLAMPQFNTKEIGLSEYRQKLDNLEKLSSRLRVLLSFNTKKENLVTMCEHIRSGIADLNGVYCPKLKTKDKERRDNLLKELEECLSSIEQ